MSPTHRSTAHTTDLPRVLVAYLIAILALQSLAAAFALGTGPLHRHRPEPASLASALFMHADRSHADAHASGQRHHHAATDTTVASDAAEQEAADAARLALTSALSLLALQIPRTAPDLRSHLMLAAPPWSRKTASTLPLYRPPRQR